MPLTRRVELPIDSYRDQDHPLQVASYRELELAAQESVSAPGVDGCGGDQGSLCDAPLPRDGCRRGTIELMRAVPGLLVKEGAEGVETAVDSDGNTIVFKIIHGSMRAIPPVLTEGLKQIGIEIVAKPLS